MSCRRRSSRGPTTSNHCHRWVNARYALCLIREPRIKCSIWNVAGIPYEGAGPEHTAINKWIKTDSEKQPFSVWQQQSEVALRLVMNAVSSNAAVGTLQLPFVTGRWLPKPGCNLLLMLSRVSTTATVAERSSLAMETWNHSIDLATRLRLRF